ncbi:MAG: L-seryl-tRNA(Sec) selenium transferase [Paracoccaceae bacterium]
MAHRRIPSVDVILRSSAGLLAASRHGHEMTVKAIRHMLVEVRENPQKTAIDADQIACAAEQWLEANSRSPLRPVFNLTGTVLHTNLGRALLAEEAIEAATTAMRNALALEFDLGSGQRGERDSILRDLLVSLTGAEDATVVNNNAAAVLLVLNTLAAGRETVISRGELIEIGGSFRMPDIMARAGTKIVEVGTTNRTHPADYENAIGADTGLLFKVHTSNYRIEGFHKEVVAQDLAAIARAYDLPLANDLGSGTLVDLSRWGLRHEPTVAEALAEGADLVTFSGDKLLGGPQAGFIVGRRDLIAALNRNPMKRALRLDKLRIAAFEATLRLYQDPGRLDQRLPTLRHLARPKAEILALAHDLCPLLAGAVGPEFEALVIDCDSQIGSGALPTDTIPSAGIAIQPVNAKASGQRTIALAAAFRALPMPVIGRIAKDAFLLDLRCLEDAAGFRANLAALVTA